MRSSDWSSDVCSSDLARSLAVTNPANGALIAEVTDMDAADTRAAIDAAATAMPAVLASPAGIKINFQLFDSVRSEEHTSELQSLMRISYAVFCLKKKKTHHREQHI